MDLQKRLDFIEAAQYRDEMIKLQEMLTNKPEDNNTKTK